MGDENEPAKPGDGSKPTDAPAAKATPKGNVFSEESDEPKLQAPELNSI